ncbi:MAG: hypothetical protein V6Z81_10980 [Parvularculales bacterium]
MSVNSQELSNSQSVQVVIGLNAAIVSVVKGSPHCLVVSRTSPDTSSDVEREGTESSGWDSLPFGPFDPLEHRTLEQGLRAWVQQQTHLTPGYVEQLYTFGDRGRHARAGGNTGDSHIVSVGYLAFARPGGNEVSVGEWRDWYMFFPWEDRRAGRPALLDRVILPCLAEWAAAQNHESESVRMRGYPQDRMRICFGLEGVAWDEEKTLERYELLYEAGLMPEAGRDGRCGLSLPEKDAAALGHPMQHDHRRILATAMGRLRGKLKYRPVIFDLMPDSFTLYELQRTVEAISGVVLHKQNFRRLVDHAGLVERTGRITTRTGGRPAELYRFRHEVLTEHHAPGLRLTTRS